MALGKKRRMTGRSALLLLLAAALAAGAVYIDVRLRPSIKSLAASQANAYAVKAMSAAVYERMRQTGLEYSDLVTISYNNAGEVASLQTDIAALGALQTDITNDIVVAVTSFSSQNVQIPLGNILGNQWFSGKGPKVTFQLIPSNSVQTTVLNSFVEAGINQTRHQILLNVQLSMEAIAPGYRARTEVDTNYVLAETIIVGAVPDAYTKVYDAADEIPGMLNDYGADNYLDN